MEGSPGPDDVLNCVAFTHYDDDPDGAVQMIYRLDWFVVPDAFRRWVRLMFPSGTATSDMRGITDEPVIPPRRPCHQRGGPDATCWSGSCSGVPLPRGHRPLGGRHPIFRRDSPISSTPDVPTIPHPLSLPVSQCPTRCRSSVGHPGSRGSRRLVVFLRYPRSRWWRFRSHRCRLFRWAGRRPTGW